MDFDGKVALVTGASRGVGAAVARALAEVGCTVACAARSTDAAPQRTAGTLDATVAAIEAAGGSAIAVPTDLSDRAQVVAMVETVVARCGRLDVLVNNAAITFVGGIDISMRRHDLVFEVNLHAPFIATRTAVPTMRAQGSGSILNISSAAALACYPGLMDYGISKIGLERMTVDLANQLAPAGIAVNCLRIDHPVASEGFVANTPEADRAGWEPAEVPAEGVVWMLSQPASYTGRREGMSELRRREGIMPSRASQPYDGPPPPRALQQGLSEYESMMGEPRQAGRVAP